MDTELQSLRTTSTAGEQKEGGKPVGKGRNVVSDRRDTSRYNMDQNTGTTGLDEKKVSAAGSGKNEAVNLRITINKGPENKQEGAAGEKVKAHCV